MLAEAEDEILARTAEYIQKIGAQPKGVGKDFIASFLRYIRENDIKMNITYTKKGDFCYPDLAYSKNDYPPLGKYGMLRKTYLIENFKAQYSLMLMNDTLWPHLLDIDKQAHDMMDTIVEQMKQERGITEQLKADDWWRWVQEVGNIRNAAEEFVLREVVYA